MQISFDLDGTIIPLGDQFPLERRAWWARRLGVEALRQGTPGLFAELQRRGHAVHVYTTSTRSVGSIRRTFRYYRIRLSRVVTETTARGVLKAAQVSASKHPPTFGFDLHIDDAAGVGTEGARLGFDVLVLAPGNGDWVAQVLARVAELERPAVR